MLQSNIKAAVFLGIAAICGLLFFIMLLVTIALIIPAHALVAGIETVLFLVLALILGLVGKSMLLISPPPKPMTTLKEAADGPTQVLKRHGKKKVEVQSKESIGRRLLISAAEAALTALAAGYARRLVSGSSTPHESGHAAVSKKR